MQKTVYEMRMCACSSDVCSSDLVGADVVGGHDGRGLAAFELLGDVGLARGLGFGVEAVVAFGVLAVAGQLFEDAARPNLDGDAPSNAPQSRHTNRRESCRERVCQAW